MSSGFFNNIRVSIKEGDPLVPIITVHDSNTNYISLLRLFSISSYYQTHYTGYCKGITPHITLLFDLNLGVSYEASMCLKQIDEDTIEFSGSAYQLLSLYDKLMNHKDLIKVECNVKREDLISRFVTNPIERFILEKGTSMIKDLSNYTIQFHKIG